MQSENKTQNYCQLKYLLLAKLKKTKIFVFIYFQKKLPH